MICRQYTKKTNGLLIVLNVNMSTIQAKKLGEKYLLLDLIGTGGMAEVYRGKLLGDKGFEKLVVIKKLLPHVAQDKEMAQLFIGEAKLAALLQHENIAATYDFGEIEGDYFLAMEYLFGKDLFTVMQRAKERNSSLETKYALLIASKICEGMDYVHGLKDLKNNPLNIIHRDLTPHNIFLTYEGKVKIIDFGIAKAEMHDNRTKAGVVKGKISYMSPEQIAGDVIDSRSDIFSIGILLYEMISGMRMYTGDTASLIRKCISVEYEHLENILPDLQPELYAILDMALSKDIESRYQTCGAMQSDIDNLQFSMSERTDSKALKNFIRDLFEDEYESDQKKAVRMLETIPDKNVPTFKDKTVISKQDSDEISPAYDKTVLYDTLKGSASGKMASFLSRGLAAILKEWKEKKDLISLQSLNRKKIFLIASICLIAFLLPGLMEKKSLIQELTNKAEQCLVESQLTAPEGDCAFKYYSEILELDKNNKVALAGFQEIADQYATLADQAYRNLNLITAKKYVKHGLMVVPDHSRLLELELELSKPISENIFKGIKKNIDNLFSD